MDFRNKLQITKHTYFNRVYLKEVWERDQHNRIAITWLYSRGKRARVHLAVMFLHDYPSSQIFK